jgi:RNA polymerase sigma-70 factor (ECF subfamily)
LPDQPLYQTSALLELQVKISQGQETALSSLLSIFTKKLTDFAQAMLHNRSVAEEIVEDVFIKLWLRRSTITSIENLQVYLYVSVKNACLNEITRKSMEISSRPIEYFENEIYDNETPADTLINSETLAHVNEIIDCLPPRCKLIFKLIREDGLNYKAVAEILSISINTIDNQMATAVKRISEAMHVYKAKSKYSKK